MTNPKRREHHEIMYKKENLSKTVLVQCTFKTSPYNKSKILVYAESLNKTVSETLSDLLIVCLEKITFTKEWNSNMIELICNLSENNEELRSRYLNIFHSMNYADVKQEPYQAQSEEQLSYKDLAQCSFKTNVVAKNHLVDLAQSRGVTMSDTLCDLLICEDYGKLMRDDYIGRRMLLTQDIIRKIANGNGRIAKQFIEEYESMFNKK